MPGFVSLQSLVEAIAGSVSDAQTMVARGQIEGLASFLDEAGRPRTLDVRVPSVRAGAAPGEEDVYAAPLMALVPHAAMRIKQVEVSFAVELGDLDGDGAPDGVQTVTTDPRTGTRRTLSVNPTAGSGRDTPGTTANVTLIVECIDLPEGLARLLGEVVKTQGYLSPPSDGGPPSRPSLPPSPPKGDPKPPNPPPPPRPSPAPPTPPSPPAGPVPPRPEPPRPEPPKPDPAPAPRRSEPIPPDPQRPAPVDQRADRAPVSPAPTPRPAPAPEPRKGEPTPLTPPKPAPKS
jgi:hypothetical protein